MEQKKQAKRNQLAQLLRDKFRNKYAVNLAKEPELNAAIERKVDELVLSNNMTEVQLKKLDQQLRMLISQHRSDSHQPSTREHPRNDLYNSMPNVDDKQSVHSNGMSIRTGKAKSVTSSGNLAPSHNNIK